MDRRHRYDLLCLLFLITLTTSAQGNVDALSEVKTVTGTFALTPFGGEQPRDSEIRIGLRTLFKPTVACETGACLDSSREDAMVTRAMNFHRDLRNIVERGRSSMHPYRYQMRRWAPGGAFERIDFSIPSLIRGQTKHPSDDIRGIYLLPHRPWCNKVKFPTAVIVHSSIDNMKEDEYTLAKNLVLLSQNIGVMMVYLPHYGPRRLLKPGEKVNPADSNVDFLNPDLAILRRNLGQAVLDLHVAIDWLYAHGNAEPEYTSMLGLSMGGILQPMFEGLNPGRMKNGHAIFVGGGDLPAIMSRYFRAWPDELITRVWKKYGWNEAKARESLAAIDPITWAKRVKNQRVLYIGALHDELMDRHLSVERLLNTFGPGDTVQTRWLKTAHAPRDAGYLYLFTKLLLPIENFILNDAPPPPPWGTTCPTT